MNYSPAIYYVNSLGHMSRRDVVAFLFSVQGSVCQICGKYMRKSQATIDHVIPRAKGGAHHVLNWALAHGRCNEIKGCNMPTAAELERHRRTVGKIRRTLFWARVLSPLNRLRKYLMRMFRR